MYTTKRGAFKKIAQMRLDEARLLFAQAYYCGAFYLAGYSIECALKAKIAKNLRGHDIPDPKVVQSSYSHNLPELLKLAELEAKFGRATRRKSQLAVNWDIIVGVDGWSEESRYNENIGKAKAEKLIGAIDNTKDGILQWIEKN